MPKISAAIQDLGPLIKCSLSVTQARANVLKSEGNKIPDRIHELIGLVDTGSEGVLIDSKHVAKLKLPVRSGRRISTIDGTSGRYRTMCEIGLIIPLEEAKVQWDGNAYCDNNLAHECDFDLIIGRDVLSSLNLHYDGPKCMFTIWHDSDS
jgi:predicted aspartyl protease